MMVDLGNRAADSVDELRLDRAQVHALLLQRVALWEEELERVDADKSACHNPIEAVAAVVWVLLRLAGGRPPAGYGEVMSRGASLFALTIAVFLLSTSPVPAGVVGSRTVLHYGDSLTVGTGLFLSSYLHGWKITESANVSRHTEDGPTAVRAYGAALPRVLVISLGANDDPRAVFRFMSAVRSVVAAAGSSRCVIWSTVVRPPYAGVSYNGYNAALRRVARNSPTLRVFDWQAMAKANPTWFGSDGVHPTATGYRARAAAVAKLVKSC